MLPPDAVERPDAEKMSAKGSLPAPGNQSGRDTLNLAGQFLGEPVDLSLVFTLDHDPHDRFGARSAHEDAAPIRQASLRLLDRRQDLGGLIDGNSRLLRRGALVLQPLLSREGWGQAEV